VKVLLDENLDPRLRTMLSEHDCMTASYAGWDGLKNGTLLAVAEAAGFEVFLTGDTKIPEEQNMDGRTIAIVVMTAHQLSIVRDHVTQIGAAIASAKAGTIEVVECGKFRR
jgi:predicted nuclease of predicted toxin-antitoxin system